MGLTVLGDLTVDGAYVTEGDYPCLGVGGKLSVRNYYGFEAETIALGGIHVEDALFVHDNHTVTIAPTLEAKTVCTVDAEISAEVRATRRYANGDIPMAELFGIGPDEASEVGDLMLSRS